MKRHYFAFNIEAFVILYKNTVTKIVLLLFK